MGHIYSAEQPAVWSDNLRPNALKFYCVEFYIEFPWETTSLFPPPFTDFIGKFTAAPFIIFSNVLSLSLFHFLLLVLQFVELGWGAENKDTQEFVIINTNNWVLLIRASHVNRLHNLNYWEALSIHGYNTKNSKLVQYQHKTLFIHLFLGCQTHRTEVRSSPQSWVILPTNSAQTLAVMKDLPVAAAKHPGESHGTGAPAALQEQAWHWNKPCIWPIGWSHTTHLAHRARCVWHPWCILLLYPFVPGRTW